MSGEVCRNQGAPMAEKPCGFCHEGPCGPERYVLLRSSDVEALMEEWGDLDCDPFWKPVAFSYVMVGSGVPATAPDRGWEIHEPDDTLIVTVEDEDPPPVPVTAPVHPGGERPPHVWLNGSCIAMLSDLPDGTWFNYDTDDPTSVDEADEHWRTMSVHPEPVTVVRWADGPTEQPEWVCGWTDVGANCLPGDPCDPDTCGYVGSTPQAPTVDSVPDCSELKTLLDEVRAAYIGGLVGYMAELLGRSADGAVWLPAPWHHGKFTDPEVATITAAGVSGE